jgi:hypothetical protein
VLGLLERKKKLDAYLYRAPNDLTGLPTTTTQYLLDSGAGSRSPVPGYYLITLSGSVKANHSAGFHVALDVLFKDSHGDSAGASNMPYLYHNFKPNADEKAFFIVQGIEKVPGATDTLWLEVTCSTPGVSFDEFFTVLFQKVNPYPV